MTKKKALVLGATGQDGSYMIDLLLKKNYEVHGLYRKSSVGNTNNIDHLINNNHVINKKFFLIFVTSFFPSLPLALPLCLSLSLSKNK